MSHKVSSATLISSRPESIWRYADPLAMTRHLWSQRNLLRQFTMREVKGRYRGSYLGMLWAFITPFLTLSVYTFVFSGIFGARWGHSESETFMDFALTLFSGMIAFNVFSDCASRSPALITTNSNYVKRVVFPLEILPLSLLGSAVIHSAMSLVIVLVGLLISSGRLHWTLVYLPLLYVPLSALTLGVSWVLASVGVFIRDVRNFIEVIVMLLFFLSAVIFPVSAFPGAVQPVLQLNPLVVIVDGFRRVVVWGEPPDWPWLAGVTIFSGLVMLVGYMWFMKIKRAFADVV
jgi:lipopolysaccharide transport system permease protein